MCQIMHYTKMIYKKHHLLYFEHVCENLHIHNELSPPCKILGYLVQKLNRKSALMLYVAFTSMFIKALFSLKVLTDVSSCVFCL